MAYDLLCDISYLKRVLKIAPDDATDDGLLEGLLMASSELIGQFLDRDNLGAVISYQENYPVSQTGPLPKPTYSPRIVLRHYPVVSLTSVLWNNQSLKVLTNPQYPPNQAGVFLQDDQRSLIFFGLWMPPSYGFIQVNYTAGYTLGGDPPTGIPFGLQQACAQHVLEMYKSPDWIGFRSKTLAGQSTVFDEAKSWGMSPRTKAMLQPYVNRIPPMML